MSTGPFQGPERLARISTFPFSRPAGNSAIETGGGGLPPRLSPALRSNKAFPRCLRQSRKLAAQCKMEGPLPAITRCFWFLYCWPVRHD